jgi:hypothetical protein
MSVPEDVDEMPPGQRTPQPRYRNCQGDIPEEAPPSRLQVDPLRARRQLHAIARNARNHVQIGVRRGIVMGPVDKPDIEAVNLERGGDALAQFAKYVPDAVLLGDVQIIEGRNVAPGSHHHVAGSQRGGMRYRQYLISKDPGVLRGWGAVWTVGQVNTIQQGVWNGWPHLVFCAPEP